MTAVYEQDTYLLSHRKSNENLRPGNISVLDAAMGLSYDSSPENPVEMVH
jgi:hypothetical protein